MVGCLVQQLPVGKLTPGSPLRVALLRMAQPAEVTRPANGQKRRATREKRTVGTPKSLFRNILPITPAGSIFCEENIFLALCFQYFAQHRGRGVPLGHRWPVASCPQPQIPTAPLRAVAVAPLHQGWGRGYKATSERRKANHGTAKSLFRNILSITPTESIFCEENIFLALCFQYFARQGGRGIPLGCESPVVSRQRHASWRPNATGLYVRATKRSPCQRFGTGTGSERRRPL